MISGREYTFICKKIFPSPREWQAEARMLRLP